MKRMTEKQFLQHAIKEGYDTREKMYSYMIKNKTRRGIFPLMSMSDIVVTLGYLKQSGDVAHVGTDLTRYAIVPDEIKPSLRSSLSAAIRNGGYRHN